jgi:hypothetical protein
MSQQIYKLRIYKRQTHVSNPFIAPIKGTNPLTNLQANPTKKYFAENDYNRILLNNVDF